MSYLQRLRTAGASPQGVNRRPLLQQLEMVYFWQRSWSKVIQKVCLQRILQVVRYNPKDLSETSLTVIRLNPKVVCQR